MAGMAMGAPAVEAARLDESGYIICSPLPELQGAFPLKNLLVAAAISSP
jgi:hypothetical protein